MGKSKIEWCDRVWNPVTGCTKVSPGCEHCYAERMAHRFGKQWGLPEDNPFKVTKRKDKEFIRPLQWKNPSKIFVCSMGDLFHEDVQERWIDGIFSIMGLTYDVAESDKENVITAYKQRHTYLILTKRPERMQKYIQKLALSEWETLRKRFYDFSMTACDFYYKAQYIDHMNASMTVATWIKDGMPGLWLGVTAENQEQADKRIPILLQIPAAKRFVSVEPMLGAVDLKPWLDGHGAAGPVAICKKHGIVEPTIDNGLEDNDEVCPKCCLPLDYSALDWVICGGESGPGARPMHPDWVRSLRDQCKTADVPFLFKQWGEYGPDDEGESDNLPWVSEQTDRSRDRVIDMRGDIDCTNWQGPEQVEPFALMRRVGKKKAGRLLDGQLWDQYPK